MKICFTGPKNLHTERWVTYFARQGHEVHLVIDEPVDYEGVIVHSLGLRQQKSLSYFVKKWFGLKKVLHAIKPDILHTHYLTGEGYVSSLTGFHPYVVTIWGNDIYLRPHVGRDERWFTQFVLKRADLITADSQDQIDAAVRLGADPGKGRVVQWGVDLKTFRPEAVSDVRERLGFGDAPVVISQRKFDPLYNIDVVIAAFGDVLDVLPNARLILTGSGQYEPDIRDLVRRSGLDASVHFTGYLPYNDLPLYLVAADISVSVPSSDGTAMTLLEAMACGVPLIVSDLPSNREWIQDGVNGFIVAVRDKEGLAQRMVQLLQSPPLRACFRQANLAQVRLRADHEVYMRYMETLYQNLIQGRPLPEGRII